MTYDTYVLILCSIVYVLMTLVTIAVICALTRMSLKLVRCGAEDKQIIKEYKKAHRKGRKKIGNAIDFVFSMIFCIVFICIFAFSLYLNTTKFSCCDTIPTFKVVNSGSMSEKNEKNKYLFENNLNDQFDTLDLILTYKLPDEFDLKLYDIVIYEYDGDLIAHRIVGIEEPNEKHSTTRHFLMQGDAVDSPDKFPVLYSQMRGIYRGEKVQFVGSFVVFMQSPAGWLCIILVLAATIATPIIDKKLAEARADRYAVLCKKGKDACALPQGGAVLVPPIYLYPVYYDPAKGVPIHNSQSASFLQNNGKGGGVR